jgi:CubicO group peptidase (beta-lactamase class C family)
MTRKASLLSPVAVSLLLAACGGASPNAAPAGPAPRAAGAEGAGARFVQIAADGEKKLRSGATIPLVKGWFVKERPDGLALEDPEREMTVTVVEVDAESAETGVAKAFAALGRKVPAVIERTTRESDVAGWDEVLELIYKTPPSAGQLLAINVRRKGTRAWATILEGKLSAFARRGAQMMQMVGGLEVPGVEDEDLSKAPMLALEGERARELETFVETARQRTNVPGVALAVVQDGQIVLEKGFGVREQGKSEAVTPRTRFMIGSVTKSLSSLLVATLVDEGKVRWDTRVRELLPSFETGDPAFTDQLTLAHTFCACTGMPRRDLDFVFEYAKATPEDTLAWFKEMKPTTGFGETFQYSNQMTALGGFLAARAAEPKKPLVAAFESAMHARVFAPLGMNDTTASYDEGRKTGAAAPHGPSLAGEYGVATALPMKVERFVVPVAPAGSVFSTAHDMARYALVELGEGRTPEGKQVVSQASLLERRKPRVQARAKAAYGLGLGVGELRGLNVVSHDGGTFGFASRMLVVPEKKLGLVILTNSTNAGSDLLDAITQRVIELSFAGKERAKSDLERALDRKREQWEKTRHEIGPLPAEAAARLAGTWRAARLGVVTLSVDPKAQGVDAVRLDAGEWSSRVGYQKAEDGTELLALLDPPVAGLPFRVDGKELVVELGQDVFRFAKR